MKFEKKPLSKSVLEPALAITPGEPAGIGPELVAKLEPGQFKRRLVILADPELLKARAMNLGLTPQYHVIESIDKAAPDHINVLPIRLAVPSEPGKLDARNGQYVVECLEQGVRLCESQGCAAMVTGPVNKAAINDSGMPFSGHTEWLAERLNVAKVVMLLTSGNLRVALVTTHLPLRNVADAITSDEVASTLNILHADLVNKFGIPSPRILVCGLNPHAGEAGYLGREEIDVINPVLEKARANGINAIGPLPADTAFTSEKLKNADAVLAMYHDQGLPVLKHQSFGNAINVTLGLPIVRTSVDHGTALDIAGKGIADPGSLIAAINLADQLTSRTTS